MAKIHSNYREARSVFAEIQYCIEWKNDVNANQQLKLFVYIDSSIICGRLHVYYSSILSIIVTLFLFSSNHCTRTSMRSVWHLAPGQKTALMHLVKDFTSSSMKSDIL